MINAKEARQLMRGSTDHKGAWFKFRLYVYKQKIVKAIEHAAEQGKGAVTILSIEVPYLKLLNNCFRSYGYKTDADEYLHTLYISWNGVDDDG